MSKYFLLQDQQKCIGCHSCEIQCKINKGLPPETRPCQVITVGPEFFNGKPRASFIFMPCFHCENAWCVSACPTGAMQRRENGPDWKEVNIALQQLMQDYAGVVRSESMLKAGLSYLRRSEKKV